MSMTPQQQDIMKAGGILAVILAAGITYVNMYVVADYVAGYKKEQVKLKEDIKKLDARLNEMKAMADNMAEVRRKQELLAEVSKKLPLSADPQGFLKALEPILNTTKVEVSELQPLALENRTVYTEVPYRIKNQGRYHDFGQFLNMCEENPTRFMRIKTFTIQNKDDRPSIHPIEVDVATFTFVTKG